MSTVSCLLLHSPLGLGDLGGLQILAGPGDTKEQNQLPRLGEVGDQEMGQATGAESSWRRGGRLSRQDSSLVSSSFPSLSLNY